MKKLFSFALILALALPYAVNAQGHIDSAVQALMLEHKAVGLSIVAIKNNKTVFTKAYGKKELSSGKALQSDDLFRIASISKSFSATAIMQLVQQGKISLDDDFGNLVGFRVRNPKFPDRIITLRMVLSHTSSINDSQGYFNFDVIDPEKGKDWQKCYNDYAPGEGYQYCNMNFNMVGAVIERISGQRFDKYIRQHILDPLGLKAGYEVSSLDSTRFATLYEYNAATGQFTPSPAAYNPRRAEISNYTMGVTTPIFSPTGGMKISAPDLAAYMKMHMNFGKYAKGRLLKAKSARLMQQALSEKEHYGLALLQTENLIPGRKLVGHTGSAYGLFSAMFFDPRSKDGFVIITNGCDAKMEQGHIALIRKIAILLDRSVLGNRSKI